MSELPKLKVRSLIDGSGEKTEICDLEQVRKHFNTGFDTIVVVEGQVVNSYDELVQLATQDQYNHKEFLEVVLLPMLDGG